MNRAVGKIMVGVLTALFLVAAATGQTVATKSLRGVVKDEIEAVIPSARLVLTDDRGVVRETVSDETGAFSFGELPPGDYVLVVTKEGFAEKTRTITLDERLKSGDVTLEIGGMNETVTVVLDSAEAAVESTMKLPVSIHETPRSVAVIGSDRIREQNLRQVSDVLTYVPGTALNSYRNGSYHFYSRGYRMGPDDTRVDGFAGVNVGSGGFGASTFGIAEIVVLKGPAALMYGQTGSPGGFVNLISKRPQERRFTRIDIRAPSYAGNGVSLNDRPGAAVDIDSTGAIDKGERILYRGLASIENISYFTRDTRDNNQHVNGSMIFKLDRDSRFVVSPNAQFVRYYRPYGGGIVASPSSSLSAAADSAGDPSGTFINRDDLSPLDVNLFGGRRIEETGWAGLDFRGIVTDKIRVNAAYRYISFDTDINSFTPQASSAAQIELLRTQGIVSRIQAKGLTERNYHNFSADASYEWINDGWVRNMTQIGFYERVLDSRTTSPQGSIPAAQSPINVYTGFAAAPPADTFPALAFGAWGRDVIWNGFVQNRTSLDNGRWNLTFGLNYGENKPVSGAVRKSGLIPNASIVFNATPELAIYGSYATSYNPADPSAQDANGNTGVFDATIGRNFEVGAKYDLLDRRVGLTIALFQNQIDNALVQSEVGVVNSNGQRYFIPAGTRRARGAEMTAEFQVRNDLRLTGGVSCIDAIYKGFPDGAVGSSSPIPNSQAEKTPRWSYNFYAKYGRKEGYLKGFGAGFGWAWQGKRLGSNGARTFASPDPLVLPAFTRMDTALFYRLNRNVEFALNLDNIFDEVIFVNASVGSAIEIAAPRTLTFRTSFNF